ncbi:alanine dehydrogenase [Tenacibaculum sp. Ill]|uniref:alanine dehydrogenase n=1 Tax=Tenacibaculum sp. Ill TaxID=3445935 RepID=UPI003F7A8341
MRISVLKEIKKDENRVALLPCQVKILIEKGHKVFVEKNAGLNSGFSNLDYKNSGAKIVTKNEALSEGELLLKVKAPLEIEYDNYQKGQTLFTYLHFDENIPKSKINLLIKNNFTGIAYEWVGKNGDYPLLYPMSKITGYLFAQKSIELLSKYKGKLAGAYENEHKAAEVLIIGLGTIGMSAFKYFRSNNIKITVVDKSPSTINERLNKRFSTVDIDYLSEINVIRFDMNNPMNIKDVLMVELHKFDIILNCAVRRSDLTKEMLDYIIDNSMLELLEKGTVVCDTTGCDKDLIESCISSSELEYVDKINGIIHYNCDHIPSGVANTSSRLLTDKTFPYVLEIASKGVKQAIKDNEYLRNGVSCYNGFITHKYSAEKKDMMDAFKSINELI